METTNLTTSIANQLDEYVNSKALILTAHPDDELLFFGPLLQQLEISQLPTLIICLTTGGWNGSSTHKQTDRQDIFQGVRRVNELQSLKEYFSVIDILQLRTPLLDDPDQPWNETILQTILYEVDRAFDENVSIYTFDYLGVTGHINHCQLGRAVLDFKFRAQCYFLRTPSWLSWIVPWFYSPRRNEVLISAISSKRLRSLFMKVYSSQHAWFRSIFLIFSPSIRVNIFQQSISN